MGFWDSGWVPAIIKNYMSVTDNNYGVKKAKSVSVTP